MVTVCLRYVSVGLRCAPEMCIFLNDLELIILRKQIWEQLVLVAEHTNQVRWDHQQRIKSVKVDRGDLKPF